MYMELIHSDPEQKKVSILSEVSLLKGLTCMQELFLGEEKCPYQRGVLISGVSLRGVYTPIYNANYSTPISSLALHRAKWVQDSTT